MTFVGIPNELDLFWFGSTDYFYKATPGSAHHDMKSALRMRAPIDVLASLPATASSTESARLYATMTAAIQNNLPFVKLAPIASTDTQRADVNRGRLAGVFFTARAVAEGS